MTDQKSPDTFFLFLVGAGISGGKSLKLILVYYHMDILLSF